MDVARSVETKRIIVVKTSHLHRIEKIGTQENPHAEVELLRKLSSDHFPKLIGEWLDQQVPTKPGIHRYAMTYGGSDLFGYVSAKQRLTENAARPLFTQILKALHHLHSNLICHLDLKMENILIDENLHIRLCDLGQAREIKQPRELLTGTVGTLSYRAPEIWQADAYEGELADMYSLGVILFIMLMGCPPYSDPSSRDLAFKCMYNNARGLERVVNAYSSPGFLSTAALDLLAGLICAPHRRLSLREVFQHPWINI